MNLTKGAKAIINQRRISKNTKSLKPGFTPIFSKTTSQIPAWDKFLGDHFINGHKQIGWKCNKTGKITKL